MIMMGIKGIDNHDISTTKLELTYPGMGTVEHRVSVEPWLLVENAIENCSTDEDFRVFRQRLQDLFRDVQSAWERNNT